MGPSGACRSALRVCRSSRVPADESGGPVHSIAAIPAAATAPAAAPSAPAAAAPAAPAPAQPGRPIRGVARHHVRQ
ncbi:hypothetical protein IHE44_0014362, partial [Lamprotornis superbus]